MVPGVARLLLGGVLRSPTNHYRRVRFYRIEYLVSTHYAPKGGMERDGIVSFLKEVYGTALIKHTHNRRVTPLWYDRREKHFIPPLHSTVVLCCLRRRHYYPRHCTRCTLREKTEVVCVRVHSHETMHNLISIIDQELTTSRQINFHSCPTQDFYRYV